MPPRISTPPLRRPSTLLKSAGPNTSRFYAAVAIKRPTTSHPIPHNPPTAHYPPTQPPSHRAADLRKTQLHRIYLSLLRSTPFLLIFQHNNVRAGEWSAIRREISMALAKLTPAGEVDEVADGIQITIIQTAVFRSAVRVAEFYDVAGGRASGTGKEAHEQTADKTPQIEPLLTGPIGCISFPVVSPQHLKCVVDILFPEGKPVRGMDPLAVSGLQKLILLAARVDGHAASGRTGEASVLDGTLIRWACGLPGFDVLRVQLVAVLQSVGGGELVRALESIPTSVVRTLDGHRKVLAGELGGSKDAAAAPQAEAEKRNR